MIDWAVWTSFDKRKRRKDPFSVSFYCRIYEFCYTKRSLLNSALFFSTIFLGAYSPFSFFFCVKRAIIIAALATSVLDMIRLQNIKICTEIHTSRWNVYVIKPAAQTWCRANIMVCANLSCRGCLNSNYFLHSVFFLPRAGTIPVLLSSGPRVPGIVRPVLRLRQARRRVHLHRARRLNAVCGRGQRCLRTLFGGGLSPHRVDIMYFNYVIINNNSI